MAITEKDIRDYFKDYPGDNPKHLEEFFTSNDIKLALRFAKDKAEKMPPLLPNFQVSSVPDYVMLSGVVYFLIQIKLNNLAINQTSGVVEHGVQLSIGEEYSALKDVARDALSAFDRDLYSFKKASDYRNSMGAVRTPYGKSSKLEKERRGW